MSVFLYDALYSKKTAQIKHSKVPMKLQTKYILDENKLKVTYRNPNFSVQDLSINNLHTSDK